MKAGGHREHRGDADAGARQHERTLDKDRPLFAAMTNQVALPVAIDIESPHHAPARNGALPHGRMNRFPVPCDIVRKADVYRQ